MFKSGLRGSAARILAACLVSFTLSACTSQPAYMPAVGAESFRPFQSISFSQQYSWMRSCDKYQDIYDISGLPKGDDFETVKAIDAAVRKRFIYTREAEDNWASRADIVLLSDYQFLGDCEDLSATVVALSRCAGVPEDRLGMLLVKANGSDTVNHMVGFFTDHEGKSYSVGDTFARPRPLLNFNQVPHSWAFLRDLSTWYKADSPSALRFPPSGSGQSEGAI
jgi:predicted transglutaminase-like cysteine proteinase